MKSQCVADIEGPWKNQNFGSGLIERSEQYWSVPVSELPNEILATFLRQRIALILIIPEARKRVENRIDDGSELFNGELEEALNGACSA